MKKLVVTIAIGETYQRLAQLTHPYMRKYAEKIGAEFLSIDTDGGHSMPHYRKLDLGELLNEYDRIIYVDTDILIRPDAPDLFEIVPYAWFGAFEEGKFEPSRGDTLAAFCSQVAFEPTEDREWQYYNTGVMVFSKPHQPIFLQPYGGQEIMSFYEQTYLNMLFMALKVQVHELSYRFNRMSLVNHRTGEDRLDAYFTHYAGVHDTQGEQKLLEMVQKDIERLEATPTPYRFKRKFLIAVQGGIGDQIEAEPALRYLMTHLYPGDEFHLASLWPELFDHLPATRYRRVEEIKDIEEMHIVQNYRDGGHESWLYMSQGAMHMADFAALQVFKGSLPGRFKQPKLVCSPQHMLTMMDKVGVMDFSRHALIHCGKGWPSKTFPVEYWGKIINEVESAGYVPVLIGKHGDKQSVLDIPTTDCIDTVDKLTLKELIALISQAPVLISNDSSPIHIAGAFDNWIAMIATVKDPEITFPYRGDPVTPYHKARAFFRDKRWEKYKPRPTNLEMTTMDFVGPNEPEIFLPDPKEIGEFLKGLP